MSYSSKVKSELLRDEEITPEEFLALISAVMKVAGTMSISENRLGFKIITENAAIARFLYKKSKELLGVEINLIISRSSTLKKKNSYILSFNELDNTQDFLIKTGILGEGEEGIFLDASVPYNFRKEENIKKAYIKGTFLGSGSISDPKKQYHIEFVTRSLEYANDIKDLLSSYGLKVNIITRKSSEVAYIKDAEGIADVLNIMGAHSALLELENVRIMKDMRNNINRLVNCETANLSKTVNAAVRQNESIRLIKEEWGFEKLPEGLREIAELRLNYPDATLKELGEKLNPPVGKSGVNHRLRKLEKIAEELEKDSKIT